MQEQMREYAVGMLVRFVRENDELEENIRKALNEKGIWIWCKNDKMFFPPLPAESGLKVTTSGPFHSGEEPELNFDAVIVYDPRRVEVKSAFVVGEMEQNNKRTQMRTEGFEIFFPYPFDRVVGWRSIQQPNQPF